MKYSLIRCISILLIVTSYDAHSLDLLSNMGIESYENNSSKQSNSLCIGASCFFLDFELTELESNDNGSYKSFSNLSFQRNAVKRSKYNSSEIDNLSVSESRIERANFTSSSIESVIISSSRFLKNKFSYSEWEEVFIEKSDLSDSEGNNALLGEASLSYVTFDESNLRAIDLTESKILNSSFRGVELAYSEMPESSISNSDFSECECNNIVVDNISSSIL